MSKKVIVVLILMMFYLFGNAQSQTDSLSINFKLKFNKEPTDKDFLFNERFSFPKE